MAVIFPIIQAGVVGRRQRICGTGFFVGPAGLFVSCHHLREPAPDAEYRAAVNPADLTQQREIHWLMLYEEGDVAIGRVVGELNQEWLQIAPNSILPGEEIRTRGFAGDVFQSEAGIEITREAAMGVVIGETFRQIPLLMIPASPIFSRRSYPVFTSRPLCPMGYSGGPVANAAGQVVGILSGQNVDQVLTEGGLPVSINVDRIILAEMLQALEPAQQA
ncbi:S1 family peptidase [Sinorhizobium fredii]|uniref:S1 family peptidase n=1 Tax=Rhizobium fredii TaxID=380 RepID=UPI00130D824E|nr:serine protease [Sinorhizobium fredii]